MKKTISNLFLLLLLLNVGCTIVVPDGEEDTSGDFTGDIGELGDGLKIQVDEKGGELEFEQIRILIPAGALSQDTKIGIRAVDPPVPFPEEYAPVSYVYECTPHGLEFAKPVEIEISYEDETERSHDVLRLTDEDDETWEAVEIESSASNSVSILVKRFSFFVAVYEIEVERTRTKPDEVPTEEEGGVLYFVDAGISDGEIVFQLEADSGFVVSDGATNTTVRTGGNGGSSGNGASGTGGTSSIDDDAGR